MLDFLMISKMAAVKDDFAIFQARQINFFITFLGSDN